MSALFFFWIMPLILLAFAGVFVFQKANHKWWEALIPFYNVYIWLLITGRPVWWLVLSFIPLVNLILAIALLVEMLKSFGQNKIYQHLAGILLFFIYFPYMGLASHIDYLGKASEIDKKHKSAAREWVDALIFAVIAATLIRAFVIEAYTIPTSSMEDTLLIGDFLFVSKFHYGPRIPMTPIAFPFAHHTMPLIGTQSYLEWVKLPYYRLPGIEDIGRNDIVVFNYPMEDFRPVDKRENYIKRCVALPGDTLEIKKRQLFVNSDTANHPSTLQFSYIVETDGSTINQQLLNRMDITEGGPTSKPGIFRYHLTQAKAQKLKDLKFVKSVKPVSLPKGVEPDVLFPYNSKHYAWNLNNYGPLLIPEEGQTVKLTPKTLPLYKRAIEVYEGHKVEEKNGKIYIDGEEREQYTFAMDYYFMMGDNRHNSADSRYWGYVPEDHIVGKAWLIWLSVDPSGSFLDKIRWGRLFSVIDS